MMKGFLLIIPILLSLISNAQPQPQAASGEQDYFSGIFQRIDSKQDPRLVELVNLHIRRNMEGSTVQGYRIEIFFSSDLDARQRAQKVKSDFLSSFPEHNVYITYVSPDFKVRVGDFRNKNDALRVMKEIQGRFPRAFVVPDTIELPKMY